jgi:hypothetical protein
MKVRRRAHPLTLGRSSAPNTHQRKWGVGDLLGAHGTDLGFASKEEFRKNQKRVSNLRREVVSQVLKGTPWNSRAALKAHIRSRSTGWEEARRLNDLIVSRTKELVASGRIV